MGSLSDFAENELLDHVCNGSYDPPATIYLALSTADPADDASGLSEPSGNGYTRKAIAFSAAASRKVEQDGQVAFDEATGAWGTITHWAVMDADSAGNMLAHGAFSPSKEVVANNTPSVATTEVYVEFSAGEISDYLANKLLDFLFRDQAFAQPDTYVALTTATVADDDDGDTITEVSGGSYARKQVNQNGGASPTWDAAAAGIVDNTHAVTFAEATASWGTVTSAAILDAASSGNLLFYDNDEVADQAVSTSDVVEFGAGELDVQLT